MENYDILIKNGYIVDGTGSPPYKADLAIKNETIAKIGDIDKKESEEVIDARGLIVAPGFIDIHNHSDLSIFLVPTADNYIYQGVTTIIVGNCGFSPAPINELNRGYIENFMKFIQSEIKINWESFGEYLEELDELNKSINVGVLVGHGTIKAAAMGLENRVPTQRELKIMKDLIREAMEAGAIGLSTGLMYSPGVFSKTEEIIELAKIASRYGRIYTSHIRNEGEKLIDSVLETIRIGIEANIPVEISHLKSAGRPNWGKVKIALKLIEEYADRGFEVGADAYPYTASSTSLLSIFPSWVREGDSEEIMRRLKDKNSLEKIAHEIEEKGILEWRRVEWSDIVISFSPTYTEVEGYTVNKLAEEWGLDPLSAVLKILLDDELATAMIVHGMCEEDVEKVMSHPYVSIGSDGSVKRLGIGKPHPRNYGAFPRVIRRYVREKKLLSLTEAIRKMTSLQANKLRIWDRGILRPGMKADVVIFNYHTIADRATFEDPHQYASGIKYVIVNGQFVVYQGKHTGATPGKLIRKM